MIHLWEHLLESFVEKATEYVICEEGSEVEDAREPVERFDKIKVVSVDPLLAVHGCVNHEVEILAKFVL